MAGIDTTPHPELAEAVREGATNPAADIPASEDAIEADVLSENIQQLIRETDDAFKTVDVAIADLEAFTTAPASPKEIPPKKSMSPALHRKSSFRDGPIHTPSRSQHFTPSTRTASVSKAKRTKSKKSKKNRSNTSSLANRVSRWTLSENVTEILKGGFLRKIEADEMLTPERLEVVRASRDYQLRQDPSRETLSSVDHDDDSSETPVDSFHLQDLPARIGSSGFDAAETLELPIQAPPSPSLDRPVRRDFSVPSKRSSSSTTSSQQSDQTGTLFLEDDEPPPLSPPPRNPARSAAKSVQLPSSLPTIPETRVPEVCKSVDNPRYPFAPVEDDESVYFHSTPYTLNVPTFRHGRIRFPKSDIMRGMNILPDDTMDWTAFQMAIGGGAGDFFSEPSDFARRADEEGLDDLASWFDEFGFEGAGALETAGSTPAGSPRTSRPRGDSGEYSSASSSATDPDTDLPIPVEHEFPHGFWNDGAVDTSKFSSADGRCKIKRWTLDGPPKKRPVSNRDSTGSLPQSPMLQLVFVGQGEEGDFVPMGYNLGHDLGDFLKWETQHAYAYGQE